MKSPPATSARDKHRSRMMLRRQNQLARRSPLAGYSLRPEAHDDARENARRRRQIERGILRPTPTEPPDA